MTHPLQEALLSVMDRKDHWAWPHFTRPGLTRAQLLVHFRHEYQVYVRDFPVLLARVLGRGPPTDVRAALAENIYEEQTGRLSLGVPHPTLFLEMMEALEISEADLSGDAPPLAPEAAAYRDLLDRGSASEQWQIGAALTTIFVEGSRHERAQFEGNRTVVPVEDAIREHPLVKHYGVPPERMRLVRAHRMVEGGHRDDAWEMVLGHVEPGSPLEKDVIECVEQALAAWQAYRDGVARLAGLTRSPAAT